MRGIVTHALNQLSEAAEGWGGVGEGGGETWPRMRRRCRSVLADQPNPCQSGTFVFNNLYPYLCKSRAQVDDGEEQSSPRESARDVKRPLLPIVFDVARDRPGFDGRPRLGYRTSPTTAGWVNPSPNSPS